MRNVPPNMADYNETYQNFQFEIPEYFNFGFDILDNWAEDRTKLALVSVDSTGQQAEKHTFWDLMVQSNRFGNLLRSMDLPKAERVFVMLAQTPEWYVVILGLIKLGLVPMPATTLCTAKDVEFRINQAEATLIVTDLENAPKVEAIAGNCPSLKNFMLVGGTRDRWTSYDEEMEKASPYLNDVAPTRSDDPLLIYFTSGTVGFPKMVLHTQASYAIAHTLTARFWQDLKPNDLHWTIADPGWAKAAYGKLFGQWTEGAALIQHNAIGRFDPKLTLQILENYGVTSFCAPPTAFRMLVLEDLKQYNLEGLRHCTSAGEPLNPEVMNIWEQGTGLTIYDGYGQTEMVLSVANFRSLPVKPGSMGKAMPGFEIGIVDEDGNELPTGEEGQIAVRVKPNRPVGLFREYWRDPEVTAQVYRGDWYLTGDKATRDKDGYFWFVGRADDLIISAGYRIGPFEVESALLEHPAVAESAVVASPDDIRGNIVKAFVILKAGYVPSEELTLSLQEHVRKVTAPYKYPRIVEFVTELPKTISGKIRRVELRQRETAKTAE